MSELIDEIILLLSIAYDSKLVDTSVHRVHLLSHAFAWVTLFAVIRTTVVMTVVYRATVNDTLLL